MNYKIYKYIIYKSLNVEIKHVLRGEKGKYLKYNM